MFDLDVCTPEREERCKKQDLTDEVHKWACENCKQKKRKPPEAYTVHLLQLRKLIKAGYPISPEDLPIETWEDLGMVSELIDLRTKVI